MIRQLWSIKGSGSIWRSTGGELWGKGPWGSHKGLMRNSSLRCLPVRSFANRRNVPKGAALDTSRRAGAKPRSSSKGGESNKTRKSTKDGRQDSKGAGTATYQQWVSGLLETSRKKFLATILFGLLGLGASIYGYFHFFGDEVIDQTRRITTEVASSSIGSKEVKVKVDVLTRAVVRDLLVDDATKELAAKFCHHLLLLLLKDPSTQVEVVNLLWRAFQEPQTKAALQELAIWLMREPGTVEAVSELMSNAVHNVLRDETIMKRSIQYASSVMGNKAVQREGGDAVWNVFVSAVTPRWMNAKQDAKFSSNLPKPATTNDHKQKLAEDIEDSRSPRSNRSKEESSVLTREERALKVETATDNIKALKKAKTDKLEKQKQKSTEIKKEAHIPAASEQRLPVAFDLPPLPEPSVIVEFPVINELKPADFPPKNTKAASSSRAQRRD